MIVQVNPSPIRKQNIILSAFIQTNAYEDGNSSIDYIVSESVAIIEAKYELSMTIRITAGSVLSAQP